MGVNKLNQTGRKMRAVGDLAYETVSSGLLLISIKYLVVIKT